MAATKASGRLSDADRLRKGILELVDTERSYTQDLIDLRDHYLEPLQLEEFFTHLELDSVLSVLHELISFHQEFLTTLKQGIALAPDFQTLQSPSDFKRVLFSLGGSFLFFSERFLLYSAYCACHARTQTRLRTAAEDPAFTAALQRLNPDGQQASSLPSLLIKPIQRVLKYPLLLHSLLSPTHPDSEEHYHMVGLSATKEELVAMGKLSYNHHASKNRIEFEAQRAMQQVAGQINDAQRLFEEFGEAFHKLSSGDKAVDLSMGDLLLDERVCWLDPPATLARASPALHRALMARVFVFKTAVVLVYKEEGAMGSLRVKKREESSLIKYKHLIPTERLEVHMDHSPDGERSALWELRQTARDGNPSVTFTLQCSDPSRRSACVSTVRSLLRAALRSRLLNRDAASSSSTSSTSSPSSLSQHYQPFGGDRLSALRARYRRQECDEPSSRRLGRNGSGVGIDSFSPPPPDPAAPAAERDPGDSRNVKRRVGASRRQQMPLNAGGGAAGGFEGRGDGGDGGGERDRRAGGFDRDGGTGASREASGDAVDGARGVPSGRRDHDDGGGGVERASGGDRERGVAAGVGRGVGPRRTETLAERRARTLDDGRSRHPRPPRDHNGDPHPEPEQQQQTLDAALAEASLLLQRLQMRNVERQRRRAPSASSARSSACSSPFAASLASPDGGSSSSPASPGGPVTPQQLLARLRGGARVVHDARTQAIAFGAERRAGPPARGPPARFR